MSDLKTRLVTAAVFVGMAALAAWLCVLVITGLSGCGSDGCEVTEETSECAGMCEAARVWGIGCSENWAGEEPYVELDLTVCIEAARFNGTVPATCVHARDCWDALASAGVCDVQVVYFDGMWSVPTWTMGCPE